MTDNTEALALFIGGPLDGQRKRVPADAERWVGIRDNGSRCEYEAWDIPAPAGRPPTRVFAPVGSTKEDVFWTLVVGFSAERAVAAAGRNWEAPIVHNDPRDGVRRWSEAEILAAGERGGYVRAHKHFLEILKE